MDAVPPEQLKEMDERLGEVFKQFQELREMKKRQKKSAGIDSELMEYRNR